MKLKRFVQGQLGFTLVELIFVIVILGIVASIGSSFIVKTVDAYRTAEVHNKLIQRGRLVLEQMSRQLRTAVPNAVRISPSANCIEFLPIVGGTYYESAVPDEDNGMSTSSTITTLPFFTDGSPEHVIIAPFFSDEVYTNSSPAARVGVGALGVGPYTSVPLSSAHRFNRNSNSKRLFIADDPLRFCLSSGNLVEYSDYGLSTAAIGDANPGGSSAIMAQGVSTGSSAFTLSPGSEDRNASVDIGLVFTLGSKSVRLNHTVFIRNVP